MNDRGFSLIEVLIAIVILGITMTGVQALFADRLAATIGRESRLATAQQLVEDRVARIQAEPDGMYGALETNFAGTENPVAGFPNYVRMTSIVRNTDRANTGDYKTITVRAWSTTRADTVARTIVKAGE